MHKRLLAASFVLALGGGLAVSVAGPAQSDGPPPHPHLHLTGVVLDESGEWPLSIRKCKPLANGQSVPLTATTRTCTPVAQARLSGRWNAVVPVFQGHTPWD